MRQYAGFGTAGRVERALPLPARRRGRRASRSPSICRRRWAATPTTRARSGEVGRVGVAIDSLDDMRTLLAGLPLDKISTSMTINATASTLLCLYIAVAEEQGVPRDKLRGTIQNDILKEYIARGTYIYPPRPSLRLITRHLRVLRRRTCRSWNTISISGYHMREAGCDAVAGGRVHARRRHRVREGRGRGGARRRRVRRAALVLLQRAQQPARGGREVPRRAAACGARIMSERFGAKTDRARALRFHCQTAGMTLTAQQPLNNVVARHAPGARRRARRLPVAAHEQLRRGARPADERGGDASRSARSRSSRTSRASPTSSTRSAAATRSRRSPTRIEAAANEYIARIDELGGMVVGDRAGLRRSARSRTAPYRYQLEIEKQAAHHRRPERVRRSDARRCRS